MVQGRVATHDLIPGVKTDFWVGISSNPENRISPNGANSLGIDPNRFKGKTISQIESLAGSDWRLVKVGLVKIWFEPVKPIN